MSITPTPRRRRIGAVSIVIGATLMAIGFMAPSAQAAPTPVPYDGNPGCAEGELEFKIDAQPADGDYSEGDADVKVPEDQDPLPAGFTITIDNVVVDDEEPKSVTFDWSASSDDGPVLIDYVLVKFANGGLKYSYDPPVSSDTGLSAPQDSISHVTFCMGGETTTDGPTDDGTTDDTTDDTTDGTTDDTTDDTTDGTTDAVLGTAGSVDDGGADDGTTDVEVEGEVVLPETLPVTGDNDRSLALIGFGLVAIGAAALVTKRAILVK